MQIQKSQPGGWLFGLFGLELLAQVGEHPVVILMKGEQRRMRRPNAVPAQAAPRRTVNLQPEESDQSVS